MANYAIVGVGATGRRIATHLGNLDDTARFALFDEVPGRAADVARNLADRVTETGEHFDVERIAPDCTAVILVGRTGSHAASAQDCLARGFDVISVSDSLGEVRDLLELDDLAIRHDARLILGAGMMPGLSDVLASHATRWFTEIEEIHVAKFGTGGPDCARQHHAALARLCFDWREDGWQRRAGGSGRELAWFPQPVQAADCYRAALADPVLLVRVHPEVRRVTARMAATRRDRLTMHLPMLRSPHPEGLLGAVRVEVRGLVAGERAEVVLGCAERPAVAAAAVAGATAHSLASGAMDPLQKGAGGLAEWVDPLEFLHVVRRLGLRPERFIGVEHTNAMGQKDQKFPFSRGPE